MSSERREDCHRGNGHHENEARAPEEESGENRWGEDVYSHRVPAGKRTYFFDVKTTRRGGDFFLTVTESRRVDETRYEKHKLFLFKEDFAKFLTALHDAVDFIRDECLPDHPFYDMPEAASELDVPHRDDAAAAALPELSCRKERHDRPSPAS